MRKLESRVVLRSADAEACSCLCNPHPSLAVKVYGFAFVAAELAVAVVVNIVRLRILGKLFRIKDDHSVTASDPYHAVAVHVEVADASF